MLSRPVACMHACTGKHAVLRLLWRWLRVWRHCEAHARDGGVAHTVPAQALPLNDVATSLAIDIGAAALFAFLLRNDLQARTPSLCHACPHLPDRCA